MPRYFFHVHVNDTLERDRVGLEFRYLSDAIVEASKARIEIIDEDGLDQLWLEIMDESGRVVAKVG